MIKNSNCLVTGGAGFIGSSLVDTLIKNDNRVVVIDNESSNSHDIFYWNPLAINYKLDIRDYKNTRELYNNIDYVFHMAAEPSIQVAINDPVEAVSVNVLGTAIVLQCSKEAGVKRVLYSSTSAAYGRNNIPNTEDQEEDCLNPYSVSKVGGENLCVMYSTLFNLDTVIFRYFNVYGDRQPSRGQYAPVIGIFLKQAQNNIPLTIVGDGEQRRDFVHVSDVVNANVIAAAANCSRSAFGQVYNVGSGKNYSVNEIASMISNKKINIDPRLGESRETLSSYKKINNVFGWKPLVDLESWIAVNKN